MNYGLNEGLPLRTVLVKVKVLFPKLKQQNFSHFFGRCMGNTVLMLCYNVCKAKDIDKAQLLCT